MVPNGWEIRQLAEVCSKPISYGIVQTGEVLKDGIPCARVVDLSKNEFDISEMIKTTEEIHQSYKKTILEKGELMMALRGEIGLVRIVPDHLVGINITRGIARLAPKNNVVDSECLLWIMRSNQVVNDLKRKAGGSALQEISLTALRKVKVAVPPLPEQRKIANILGTWDNAISTTERLIDNSKQQKKALMQQLLTGDHKGKRLLDDSGKPFDGEWEEVTLDLIASLTAGGTPSTKHPEYWGGDIPWMNSGDVNLKQVHSVEGRITELGLQKSSTKEIPVNSVLIALAGQGKTRGTVAINRIKLCTNQSIAAIMPNAQKLDSNFLYFNLDDRYLELRAMSTGDGGRGGLNLSILKSIKLKLPSLTEQQKIASVLTNADQEIKLLAKQLADLKQEKKALMQQLLTGKRRVKITEDAA